VVVVVGDVAVVVVLDISGGVGVRVPDRQTLAILVPRALDLVRGCRDAPVEPVRGSDGGRKQATRVPKLLRGDGLFGSLASLRPSPSCVVMA
jgi:hypothetical protein